MRYTNLQILRTAAAVSVLLFHLTVYAKNVLHLDGPAIRLFSHYVFSRGVVLFFALSGFVLTHSLQTTPVRRFLAQRLLRIYPAYWGATALMIGWNRLLYGQPAIGRHLLQGLTLLPLGPRSHYPLSVEWTLLYELFFYGVLSVFALAGAKRGILIGAAVWLAVMLAKLWVRPGFGTEGLPLPHEIGFSAYNVSFVLGVFAYFFRDVGRPLRVWVALFLPPLLALSFLYPADAAGYVRPPKDWCLVVQGVTCALLVWTCAGPGQVAASNWLARFGDWTYGVYLLHAPFIMAVYRLFLDKPVDRDVLVVFAGSLALAVGAVYGRLESALYQSLKSRLTGRPVIREIAEPRLAA